MKNEYAARPTKLVVPAAASITATAVGTPTTIGTVAGVSRFVSITSTSNQAVALTIQYPGEAPQDFIEIPATTTAVFNSLTLGASDIRLAPSVTIGGYNLGVAPTSGRISITFM